MKKFIKLFIPKSILEARSLLFEKREREKHLEQEEKKKRDYIQNLLSQQKPIKLEIGSGEKKGTDGWVTLDLNNVCDIKHNLLFPLPFPDNAITKIYSSHVLEHFYYVDLIKLLKECYRVIKSNGEFIVSVPDASIYLKAYFDDTKFDAVKSHLYKPAYYYHSKIDYVNYIAYMENNHRHLFDRENLIELLKIAGFKEVSLRNFDPLIDLKERDFESIYAKAIK